MLLRVEAERLRSKRRSGARDPSRVTTLRRFFSTRFFGMRNDPRRVVASRVVRAHLLGGAAAGCSIGRRWQRPEARDSSHRVV